MQTLFILEYQASNNGSASALPPLGYTVSNQEEEDALVAAFFTKCAAAAQSSCDTHTVMIVTSEGEVWRGYKQTLRHGHEVADDAE